MFKTIHLSVIIPAYNEEKIIAKNIITYNNYLKTKDYSYEFVIVNDGSRDNTAQEILNLQKTLYNIIFINNNINQGKGAAVKEGLLRANGDYRLFLDADNSTSINHLDLVWKYFSQDANIVIGSRDKRDVQGVNIQKPQSRTKTLLGKIGNKIFQSLTVKNIWDTQCGFKIFSADFVKKILPKTTINRWAIDAEILTLAQKYDFTVKIIPVTWINSERKSKVKPFDYIMTFFDAVRIKWNLLSGKYD